jgi:hypothetical protein
MQNALLMISNLIWLDLTPRSRSSLELKNSAAPSAHSEPLCLKLVVPLFHPLRSPTATPFLRVRNYSYGTCHFILSKAACIVKRNRTGLSPELCRNK